MILKDLPVEQILSLINSKEISIDEVVEYYLERIKKFNHSLNAIVSLKSEEKIREEARNKKLHKTKEGKEKLLFGLPLAVKDLTDVKGLPTSYGLPELKNNIANQNSIIVDRLINHGAIIVGKTNTPEFGIGSHTKNKLFGVTANVFNSSKSAGGSSGGAASAVASSMVPFADGSDMMGSCRNPAAYANLYGFRPTPGLIPEKRDLKPENTSPVLSTLGCMAKTPDDMALFLDAVSGKDSADPYSFNILSSFREHIIKDEEFSKLTLGWPSDLIGNYQIDPGIIGMCEKALHNLENVKIKVIHLESKIKSEDLWNSWTTLRAKNNFDDLNEMNLQNPEDLGFPVKWEYQRGKEINSNDIDIALSQRIAFINKVDKLFKDLDFLVMPSAQIFPFNKELDYPKEINGNNLDTYHRWMEVVILVSLLGLPSISVPIGFNNEGLPMGMQIIGKRGDDLKVVAFAKRYEEIFTFSSQGYKL